MNPMVTLLRPFQGALYTIANNSYTGGRDKFSRGVSDVNCSGAKTLDDETKVKLCESSAFWSEVDIKKSFCAR